MDIYNELLEATIEQLRGMRARGIRHVAVDAEMLKNLQSGPSAASTATPARTPRPPEASPAPGAATVLSADGAARRPQLGEVRPAVMARPVEAPKTSAAPLVLASSTGNKAEAIRELRERAIVCQKCPNLVATRQNVVFGVGSIDADLMFVGEAPGADEDVQGEPFVGRAGQLLTKIIQTMGLTRETVYIANILKCRPDTPGQESGNRPPTKDEMDRCLPYLHAQIDLIKPKAIVALGSTAVDGLFGKVPGVGITRMRGKWREYRGIPVMPTYHPSYLLRPNVNNVKREAWEDMLQVMERLGIPISEKQRGYFLSKS